MKRVIPVGKVDKANGHTSSCNNKAFKNKLIRQIFVVTGMSGSGKSSVLRALEDLGFYCVDNLPIPLLSTFIDFVFKTPTNLLKVALGIDARGGDLSCDFLAEIEKLKKYCCDRSEIKVIFLSAEEATLIKRFQETRRKHPLSKGLSLVNAIKREREILEPIKSVADEMHHTDSSNPHDLRLWVSKMFSGDLGRRLVVNVISFGFKHGVPAESNLVYDLRFLPNPYFVPALKILDGREKPVQEYLFEKDEVKEYWDRLEDFLRYLLHSYYEEGRFFANVSIGCTGGKHRSVAFVEKLCKKRWANIEFMPHHRDVEKE